VKLQRYACLPTHHGRRDSWGTSAAIALAGACTAHKIMLRVNACHEKCAACSDSRRHGHPAKDGTIV